ncbi:hypothetical protein BDZ89DRAFT_92340 [Hymenopellis radicata]|nr:hypothetical protein BDZ89DRAFT_92340 [Hymenopellis radicata]
MAVNALHNRFHTFSIPTQHYMINYKPAYPMTFYKSRLLIKELNAKIGGLQSELCNTSVVNSAAISQDQIVQSMERLFLRADARCEERLREVEELKQQVSVLQSELARKPSDDVCAILQSLQRNSEALLARSLPPERPATATKELEGKTPESLTHTHLKLKILSINRELQETKERLTQSLFKSTDDEEKWRGDVARLDALVREKSAELEEFTSANNELTISRDYFYSMVSQYEAEKSSMDGDLAEIEGLRADVKNLKAELEEKSHSLARALQEVDDSQVAADGLRFSLDDMHLQLRDCEDSVAGVRRETARVEEEKLRIEAALEEKDTMIKELEQEKDELIEETSRLTYKVEDQREEMRTLQAIVKETTMECAAKEEKLKEAYTLCTEKDATIATLTKDKTRLATQADSDATKIEEVQNEIDELYRERRELQADLKKERVERKNSVKLRHELSEKLVALQVAQKKALTDNRTVQSQLESLVHAAERRKKDVVATASVLSGARDSWILDREFEPEDGGAASASSPSLRLNTNELMARAHRRAAEQGQAERMRRRPRGRLPLIQASDLVRDDA